MSYSFSKKSEANLTQCSADLQTLFRTVIKHRDCSIICGQRGEMEQNAAYDLGHSKLRFPKSKHNKTPSLAVDVIPYPFAGWSDIKQFREFGNFVLGVAAMLKSYGAIESDITWGGNWTSFRDYPHYQI